MADTPQYDTTQLDEVQHPTLGPLKFPKAMPPDERNSIIEGMEKSAKPVEAKTQAAPPQESFWKRAWRSLNQKLPRPAGGGEESELASSGSEGLGELGGLAKESAEKQQTSDLTNVAKTGQQPSLGNKTSGFLKNVMASTLGAASGITSPKSQAIGAGLALAPEVVGPAMVAHGLYEGTSHAPGALKGNPEEAEQSLGGFSEAAGGGAATGAAFEGGVGATNSAKVGKMALNSLKGTVGTRLSPTEATTARPEGAFQPPLANTPKEVLQHASQEGIDLTPFQASGSKLAGKLQLAGEHGIVGGQTLEKALNVERAKFGDAVNRLSEKLDPTRLGLSEESAGEAIKQAANTAKDVSHTNASNGYKQIDYLMPEKVDPAPISKKWMEVRESLPIGVEDQIKAQVPRNLRAVVEDMLSAKPEGFQPTVEQAIKLRSFFREMGETEGLPGSHEAAFRQLSQAADSAIESTARKLSSEKEWRDANAGWKDYATKYGDKQSPLYKILRQADPAKITRDITNRASASDITILRNEGMTSALEPLRRQVIQDIARNKFTVGRDGLGGYSDSFLRQLFGPAAQKELYLKADLARRMNWEPNPSGTGGTMLAGEQLSKPSKIAQLFGAAKMSMPRSATSYLPNGPGPGAPSIDPRVVRAAIAAARQQQNQQP